MRGRPLHGGHGFECGTVFPQRILRQMCSLPHGIAEAGGHADSLDPRQSRGQRSAITVRTFPCVESDFDLWHAARRPRNPDKIELAKELLASLGSKLLLPVDHVVVSEIAAGAPNEVVERIPDDKIAVDIGPATIAEFSRVVAGAKTIIWNGPMGIFEKPPFDKGTVALAKAVADSGAISVVGGGDSAMEEANFLSRFASKVYLIHRRPEFRASKIMVDRARANEKIQFVTPVVVEDILDVTKGGVESMKLRNTQTNEVSMLPVSGIFVAIGHEPTTKLFRGKLDMDENGYLITHHGSQTKVPGVFAAGDVQDHHCRQAITAAGSGCMAALDAEKFLEAHKDA